MSPDALLASRTQRASALPPDERRATIIAATLPLLVEHGRTVTTRMIANAAGIAEGTIFRVFPDKDSLISAAVATAFDPAPMESALRGIDHDLPLEEKLRNAVVIMQQRLTNIWRLISSVGPDTVPTDRPKPSADVPALVALFEGADQRRLTRPPLEAARMLRALTLAMSHPSLIHDDPMEPGAIVALLLDGIRNRTTEETRNP